jgi:hypothetical protein
MILVNDNDKFIYKNLNGVLLFKMIFDVYK